MLVNWSVRRCFETKAALPHTERAAPLPVPAAEPTVAGRPILFAVHQDQPPRNLMCVSNDRVVPRTAVGILPGIAVNDFQERWTGTNASSAPNGRSIRTTWRLYGAWPRITRRVHHRG